MAKRLGELLIEAKVITQEQLDHVLTLQRGGDGRKLGQLLGELRMVTETQLTQALSRQLAVPWVTLYHVEFSRALLNFVPRELAEKYNLVPVHVRKSKKAGEELFVAMDDPTNDVALKDVARVAGIPVKPMIACPSDIRSAIRVYYGGESPDEPSSPSLPEPLAQRPPPLSPPARSSPDLEAAAAASAADRAQTPTQPEISAPATLSEPAEPIEPMEEGATSEDHPGAETEIQATEIRRPPRKGPRMVALTLLDGTTIRVPAAGKKRGSEPDAAKPEVDPASQASDQLTARDLISALRAVAHGADASEILGERPPGWEAMFAALLSLMLKKGLIADWEFIEEYRKI